jgi:hypothetical protein
MDYIANQHDRYTTASEWLGGVSLPKGNGHFLHFVIEGAALYRIDTETGEKTNVSVFVAPKNEQD